MLYGSGDQNKLEYAKVLTAALTYLIVQQRDSVGLNIFDEEWRAVFPPSTQTGHVLTILQALESLEPADKTSMGPLIHDIAQRTNRRGLVFLISDCFDDVDALLSGLQHLRFQG